MSWKPETYKASEIDAKIKEGTIVTPSYQRGAVWKEDQRTSLIDSIKRGFPFGSILLNKRTLANGQVRYDLIDGLQRCTTINKFLNSPGKYFKADDIDELYLKEIYNFISPAERNPDKVIGLNEIADEIAGYVQRNLTTMDQVKSIQYYAVASALKNRWPSLTSRIDDLIAIIEKIFTPFKKTCTDLTDAEIPAIIYDGDQSLLPEVFERINSKGTTLSKYDIYAASWTEGSFSITDSDFSCMYDSICKRYEDMNDSDIRVADFDASDYKRQKTINAFDLCFAFGKMLKSKYPKLFGVDSNGITVDGIGFNLINSCMGKPATELSTLNIAMAAHGPYIQNFLRSILKACDSAFGYLQVIITLKGNSKTNTSLLHSENQIISIVASIFLNRFCKPDKNDDDKIIDIHFDSAESPSWPAKDAAFKRNIPINYVSDAMANLWSGTGDKRLYNIICDAGYYLRDVTKADFENNYDSWFNSTKQRNEEKNVKSPNTTDKIVLNIYTSQTALAIDAHNSETWDIEHICPKKIMKDRIVSFNKVVASEEEKLALPISSIGNVCYLPSTLNRTKEEKTIYEAGLSAGELVDIEKKYSLTEKSDLDWLADATLSANQFKTSYLSFIKKRAEKIKKLVSEFLFGQTTTTI